VYIGPKRYFVTSDVGDGRIQWYAFFALPPGTKKAPSGWGGSTRDSQSDPQENLVEYIKGLHEGWSEEVFTVLDATPPDSVEQRDLYDRSPELLRSWADGNVVLMGDAVHVSSASRSEKVVITEGKLLTILLCFPVKS
jgi:zeaxanthin epoxidase